LKLQLNILFAVRSFPQTILRVVKFEVVRNRRLVQMLGYS